MKKSARRPRNSRKLSRVAGVIAFALRQSETGTRVEEICRHQENPKTVVVIGAGEIIDRTKRRDRNVLYEEAD